MNFSFKSIELAFLFLTTLAIGVMQVLTPLFLRALIDGVLPSKDVYAISAVVMILGVNELFLVLSNSLLNRELDRIEIQKLRDLRQWMLSLGLKNSVKLVNPDSFYHSLSGDTKKLVYKKIKNPWYRGKDFIVLFLLSFICLSISDLAGYLVLTLMAVTFFVSYIYKTKQGNNSKDFYSIADQEKKIFDKLTNSQLSLADREDILFSMQSLSEENVNVQKNLSKTRSQQVDITNLIRFFIMFSILSLGGYLITANRLSMGSLWALLITMYRVSPPLQSIARWLLQKKSDDNLEDRIADSMKVKEIFIKPKYYNRLTKILESTIRDGKSQIVVVDKTIELSELYNSLEYWKKFFSQSDRLDIHSKWPHHLASDRIHFVLDAPKEPLVGAIISFFSEKDLVSSKVDQSSVIYLK